MENWWFFVYKVGRFLFWEDPQAIMELASSSVIEMKQMEDREIMLTL